MLLEGHKYKGLITGQPRISVTTLLAEEGWIQKQYYREGKAELGVEGHKLLHLYDMRKSFTAPDIYARYLTPYQNFLDHTKIEVIDSEVEVEDPLLEVSGTLDKLVDMPGVGIGILDVKFSQCGWLAWHELQTEGYKQGLRWHPKYKDLKVAWRGGIIMRPDCEMPKLITHNRIIGSDKIWQSIAVANRAKHRYNVETPEISKEEGWLI